MISRRDVLSATTAGALLVGARRALGTADDKRAIGLGFSLYGMRSLPLAEALKACASVGYECVELPLMSDWPGGSAKFSADARRDFRTQLNDLGLRLAAVMENLPALGDEAEHAANLERLKRACALAAGLKQTDKIPVVETILGAKA